MFQVVRLYLTHLYYTWYWSQAGGPAASPRLAPKILIKTSIAVYITSETCECPVEGGTEIDGIWKQTVEDDTWTYRLFPSWHGRCSFHFGIQLKLVLTGFPDNQGFICNIVTSYNACEFFSAMTSQNWALVGNSRATGDLKSAAQSILFVAITVFSNTFPDFRDWGFIWPYLSSELNSHGYFRVSILGTKCSLWGPSEEILHSTWGHILHALPLLRDFSSHPDSCVWALPVQRVAVTLCPVAGRGARYDGRTNDLREASVRASGHHNQTAATHRARRHEQLAAARRRRRSILQAIYGDCVPVY